MRFPKDFPLSRPVLRRLWQGLVLVLLVPPLLLSLFLLGLKTDAGQAWLVGRINRLGDVQIQALEGSPWGTLRVTGLVYEHEDFSLRIDQAKLGLRPYALLGKRLWLKSLEAGEVVLAFKPRPPGRPPAPPLADLQLPFGLEIERGAIHLLRLKNPVREFSSLRFNLASSGRLHHLQLQEIHADFGRADADLVLDGRAPFALAASWQYAGKLEGRAVSSSGKAIGHLRDLQLRAEVRSGSEVSGKIDARLDLLADYAYQMLRSGRISLTDLNPARLFPELPQASLNIALDVTPTGEDAAHGRLEVRNARPGPIDQRQLPLRTLSAELAYQGGSLNFQALKAHFEGKGTIGGQGQVRLGSLNLALSAENLDLARFWSRQTTTALSGQLFLQGPWLAPDVRGEIRDAHRQAALQLDLGWLRPERERRLAVRTAILTHGQHRLSLQGEIGLDRQHDYQLSGRFAGLNPAQWLAAPAGRISGSFKARGEWRPSLYAALDFDLAESLFNGEALAGRGHLRLDQSHFSEADFWLALGKNRVQAQGALGRSDDVLRLDVDAPVLRALGAGFGGSARGKINLLGSYARPLLDAQGVIADLQTPWGVAVRQATFNTRVQEGETAPLLLALQAEGVHYQGRILDAVQVKLAGTRQQHQLNLAAEGVWAGEPIKFASAGQGRLAADWHWLGRLNILELTGPQKLQMLEGVDLQLSPQAARMGPARWQLDGARIETQGVAWQDGVLETGGKFTALALAPLLKRFAPDFAADLVLGGRWQLRWAGKLDGEASVWRETGDSIWRVGANRIPFALQDANLHIALRQNWADIRGAVQSARYGALTLAGDARLATDLLGLDPGAPLNLQATGRVPDLSAFNALGGADFQVKGQLDFDLAHQGIPGQGRLSGQVNGQALSVQDRVTGLDLHDGVIRLSLTDQTVLLQEARFLGGKGSMSATGRLALKGGTVSEGRAEVVVDHLKLFGRPDLLLVLSGTGALSIREQQLEVTGQLKADEGDIRYRAIDTPRLSDDVIVTRAEPADARKLPQTSVQLDMDLGEQFRFRGYGVDALLGGKLRVRAQPAKPLAAYGSVQVQSGLYRAYGRRLDIEKGLFAFQGPVDNPELDILAMRRNLSVEAGVIVKGSARNPRVQLYSEPTVPDTEKLSWLLLGHGTENMEKTDSTLLLQGVRALLADDDGGPGTGERILDAIGVEEVDLTTVKSTDGKPTQVVSVSKRIGLNMRLSLEKSVNGLNDAVKLAYQLSQRWSLITRWGTDQSSVEASYTFRFD